MDKNRKLCRQHSLRFCFANSQEGGTTTKLKNSCTHSNRSDQDRAPIYEALESFPLMCQATCAILRAFLCWPQGSVARRKFWSTSGTLRKKDAEGCSTTGPEDPDLGRLNMLA